MTFLLIVMTTMYLIGASIQDLRKRAIYTFPCTMLTALWGIEIAICMQYPWYVFLGYMVVSFSLYGIFTARRIWGAGDSDLFLLFLVIYLSVLGGNFNLGSLCMLFLLFALALIVALLVGLIESKLKRKKLDKRSSIAVAPGFAVVMIMLMWKGVIGC